MQPNLIPKSCQRCQIVASCCFPRPPRCWGWHSRILVWRWRATLHAGAGPDGNLRESCCRHQVSSSKSTKKTSDWIDGPKKKGLHCQISPWPPETPPTLAFAGGAHRRGEERRFFLLWADGLGLKADVSATALNDPNDPNNPGCYSLC